MSGKYPDPILRAVIRRQHAAGVEIDALCNLHGLTRREVLDALEEDE